MRDALARRPAAHASHVVATTCPRCAAPLDFAEASNAVRCAHCAVVLLVTGRRRVLSYAIAPRVSRSEARALVGSSASPRSTRRRLAEPRLLLVPYHRLVADEIFWRRKPVAPPRRPPLESLDLGESLLGFPSAPLGAGGGREEIELVGRRIERTLLACETSGLASWSLGVRSRVLRLELFRRDALDERAVVLPPTVAPDAARARALSPLPEVEIVHRGVLRATLSVVYFPLWLVETFRSSVRRATAVDAVSGSIVARDADPAALAAKPPPGAPPDRVLGFRPLTCPNCGWDLPLRPDDVVFHCAACERTWELVGEDLERVASVVAAAPAPRGAPSARRAGPAGPAAVEHRLPVWEVRAAARLVGRRAGHRELPERLFAPAFRWRALKALCDLGARLSRRAPEVESEPGQATALVGCSLDRTDAVTLARLIALRLVTPHEVRASRRDALPSVELDAQHLRLLWLPFAGDAYSVREPYTGCALPRRSVEELVGAPGTT